MAGEVLIRPMKDDDVAAAERLSDETFFELDVAQLRADWDPPEHRSDEHRAEWEARTRHMLSTDPDGCWVADVDGEMAGFATSFNRELMWLLATFTVRPGFQGRGIGAQLLQAAMHHGRGCLRGMITSSQDPKAARRYRLAGFTLHPAMFVRGTVAREVLPVVERVRDGSPSDFDLMDSVDRQTRGAAHGPDHELLHSLNRLLVVDHTTGSGYAYVNQHGAPVLVAASNRRTAVDLVWEALASTDPNKVVTIGNITAVNEWAVDVGLQARLELHQIGYLALRGMKPPSPYLHHGMFM